MLTLIHNNKEHNQVSELLPWYVNQTLSSAEQQTVEKHISDCEVCQQEISLLKTTFESANDFDAAVISSNEQFDSIMQRIERTENSDAGLDKNTASKIIKMPWYQLPQMAMAASFLGAMLMLYWASPFFRNDYQVLTSPDTTAVEIEIVFESNTNNEEALNILTELDSRFILSDSHPQYRFTIPADYDLLKIGELVKQLETKNQIANVRIVREDESTKGN